MAAFLDFDPKTVKPKVGGAFDIKLKINAEEDEILSTDARLIFDPKLLTVTAITDGDYFSIAKKDFSQPGKVYIAGIVETPGDFETGEGVLATITFKAVSSGVGTITVVCNPGETAKDSNIAKNVLNVTDVIDCPKNGKVDIVIGGGTGSGSSGSATGGSSSSSSKSSTPSALPKSGTVDDIMHVAIPGTILLFFGLALKFLL